MPSFFDTVYGSFADLLSSGFADETPVVYRNGESTESIDVIIRAVDTKEVFTSEIRSEVKVVELVIRKCSSAWKGIANPVLDGQFEFFGYRWEQMVSDQAGINSESRAFSTLTVRRVGLLSIGHPDRYREPEA